MENTAQDHENVNPTDQPPGTVVNLSLSEIEALRDRIEQQKANKLKAEQIVSTLSRIKAREKATRRSVKPGEKKLEDGVSNQPTKRSGTQSSNALKEKSNLLKKKLEEDRAKFESKRGQEDLGKVSQIVEHIRVQLEDQDKTIQQIHSNFATKAQHPVEEVTPEPDIPPEVKQRIADLEMKILDLQENLKEKDSVISARTQAITLLSEDMARKGKNTLDTLEETRCQMKTMQANFVALEDRMNEERARLKDELEAKKLRLPQLEKNYRAAESARFDLSTRVAELQEKVVALQTRNIALEEECVEAGHKTKELSDALENSNTKINKMKAQFKTKLKAVEEERDMLKKEERTNDELNRLRERIADLEDEKGNLQLHLVDFDEIQDAGLIMKERIAELEEKLERQEHDLDSHIKAITSLEVAKLDLIEATNQKNQALKEKDDLLESLKTQIELIEQTKITAEMKCLELEEKLDEFLNAENASVILSSQLEEANQKLIQYQETINELTLKLHSSEGDLSAVAVLTVNSENTNVLKNVQDLSSSVEEWQQRYSLLEEKLNATLAYCEELENRKRVVESENERLLTECERLRLNSTIDQSNKILMSTGESSTQDDVLLRQTLAQKELEMCNMDKHNKLLETEVESLRHSLQSTTEELHRLHQEMEELRSTQQKITDLNAFLDNKEKELEETASELNERSRKLSDYKKFHKLKSEDVLRVSHELETVTASSQQKISELEAALSNAQRNEEELRKEIKELKQHETKAPESLNTKIQEQTQKMKKLAANLKIKTKLVKELEAKVDAMEKTSQQSEILISSLENEKATLQKQLFESCNDRNEYPQNIIQLEEKCRALETEISSLQECLKSKSDEIEYLKNNSNENCDNLLQIQELENQNKKLQNISETKSDQLRKMEDDMSQLNVLNTSLMTELEQMQDTYKQDALKNESVLDGFESEMLGNRKDILELSSQLREVTSKYEQTWAKLQEKEGYVEDLEQQLEKVRSRLLQIESTVEDRRRSMEEKTELLGSRLSLAERNNEELEKHEGELEQKIAFLLSSEEMLGNLVDKLQKENGEISKSLSESTDRNILLSQEIDNERSRSQHLLTQLNEMQTSLVSFDKISEEYETIKTQFKELQDTRGNKVKYLENRLAESEQYLENEVRRLSDKISVVEAERQEIYEKFNSLLIEKHMLEDEMGSLQQTISDISREEVEQLKNNHANLAEQLNEELGKRQKHINRIEELESQLLDQTMNLGSPSALLNEEILTLRKKLDNEVKENDKLKYELMKEKATHQVDNVISKAEEKYFTMTCPTEDDFEEKISVGVNLGSAATGSHSDPFFSGDSNQISSTQVDKITEMEGQIMALNSENASLKSQLQEYEHHNRSVPENASVLQETEDWAAVSKDEDDGWGWGSKDAMLEHEYSQKQKVNSELQIKVSQLESRVCQYEEDNSRLAEELKIAQAKCSKLIKKVKEFKLKSDSLERNSRERSVGFDDLDVAMQEELRSQIEILERSYKECNANLSVLQSEKEGFLKRIDVLTSGNERLVEMKERQDIEVEMWQRRSNELQNKVQGLEWTIAELHAEQDESKDVQGNNMFSMEEKQHFLSNALEMEEKVNALAAENDYLQALLVEFKDKDKKYNQANLSGNSIQDVSQQYDGDDSYLQLRHENERLNNLVQSQEEKFEIQSKQMHEITQGYAEQVDNLVKERESNTLEMKVKSEVSPQKDTTSGNEQCSTLQSENQHLTSKMSFLNESLVAMKKKNDALQAKVNNYIAMMELGETHSSLESNLTRDNESFEDDIVVVSSVDSPTLFRGFTSSSDGPVFNVSAENPFVTKSIDQAVSVGEAGNHLVNFFDTVSLGTEFEAKQVETQPVQNISQSSSLKDLGHNDALKKIDNLKALLSGKESELIRLREHLTRLEVENNDLKVQMEGQVRGSMFHNPMTWGSVSSMQSDEASATKKVQWDTELNSLNNKLEEKDNIIHGLREKLHFKPSASSDDGKNQFLDLSSISNESFNKLFSQSEDGNETQINYFVEEITKLTKSLRDKEIEIDALSEKKKKYKEMYIALAKDLDVRSPDQSNSDSKLLSDQNDMLNQLLEDKETELEIMSQQIDQSKVAKENLQDELCLKLHEMEAAQTSFENTKMHSQEMLLEESQPENIEDVRTLCAEITELTKLLQEKESEVEVLKQQIDESNLEKENLVDEWKKEIEKYKEISKRDGEKTQCLEKEIDTFKEVIVADIEKQFKDELSLKDQQLMNAMNDLHNTSSFCQDMQTKLNDLQNNLKSSQLQNEILTKELNDLKHFQSSIQLLTQEIGYGTEMSLIEKVQQLKDNLLEIEIKCQQARSEIEVKDKTIYDLKQKDKTLESNADFDEKAVSEQPFSSSQTKTFTSEPFRISTEQSSSDDDSSSKHMETIQGQTFLMKEIQSLKQVLAMKDAEITRLSIALNEAHENIIRGEMRLINSEEESLRNRLDEALYTLHLRDVRCDELTLELMQLLEERDSLQLRLSTAIRFNEQLRQKSKLPGEEAALKVEDDASPPPVREEDNGNNQQLKQKLDQLHNVGYRRDPGMQQDQQRRHHEQMHLFTHQTPQDDSQQSSGFFNWIFGSSSSSSQDV